MATQVNVRLSDEMLGKARQFAQENGYENLQDFIRETIREKIHPELSQQEALLIRRLIHAAEEKNQYKNEKELFRRLRQR